MLGNIPPPPSTVPIVHPLQDHCRLLGRGLTSLSDVTLDQIPVHRIVLCQSRKLKQYFTEHPDEKELNSKFFFSQALIDETGEEYNFDRSIVEMALDYIYGADRIGIILRDGETIVSLFRWLLNMELFSILPYVCKNIDTSVNISVYFRMYRDLLMISTFARSDWETNLLSEIQIIIEEAIQNNLRILNLLDLKFQSNIKEGIKNFKFSHVVFLIERVLCKHLNFSDMVQIICSWAEGNEERTESLGELLMICDQSKNGFVPPPPRIQPTTSSSNSSVYSLFRPPASLLFGDENEEEDYDDDWN